jgi:hypothetical protein
MQVVYACKRGRGCVLVSVLNADLVSTSSLFFDACGPLVSAEFRNACILQGSADMGQAPWIDERVFLCGNVACMVGCLFVWCGVVKFGSKNGDRRSEGSPSINCTADDDTRSIWCRSRSNERFWISWEVTIALVVLSKLRLLLPEKLQPRARSR